MVGKSCFNCNFLKTWNHSGDTENPPDSGWDCSNEHAVEFDFFGEEENGMEDKEVASFYADRCTEWKYSDRRNEENKDYLEGLSPITHAVNVYYGRGSYTAGGCDTGEYLTCELHVEATLQDKLKENCLFVGSKKACDRFEEENYLSYTC